MIAAKLPRNESDRLVELHKLRILDTPPEKRFDRIVALAADYFNVPICYVSFVDSDRQWLKASMGLNFKQTPRNISMCAHTLVSEEDYLIVPDAAQDERFCNNPLVTDPPNIRFYAGAAIKTIDGFKIGTLCLAHQQPMSLTQAGIAHLKSLAAMVEDLIQLYDSVHLKAEISRQKNQISEQKQQIENKNAQLKNILDEVARLKINHRSVIFSIVTVAALVLLTEVYFDPLIEEYAYNTYISLAAKIGVALLFKPFEGLYEKILLKRSNNLIVEKNS